MGTTNQSALKPLWLEIEEGILGLSEPDLQDGNNEATVRKIAAQLDDKGFNASRTGGHLLDLRWALEARRRVGRPLMADLNDAFGSLTLDQVANPHKATLEIIRGLGKSWPILGGAEQIRDVGKIVEGTRLKLLVEKAKEMEGDKGIRFLRKSALADSEILEGMEIPPEELARVDAAMAAEKAEIERVKELLRAAADRPEQDRIKHLLNHDVAAELIVEVGGFQVEAIAATKTAMEEEIREKQRLAEEAEARRRAAAEGPSLEDIPADEMLEHIEAIREILDFSDQEKEIRVMCEQSSVPKALVDIAVSDPDKLDGLEEKAEAEA